MNQKYKGIMFMTLSSFSFAVMSLLVRFAGDLPVFEKAFFRNALALIIAYLMVRKLPKVKTDAKDKLVLTLRAALGTVGIVCNVYAVDHLILADAGILNKVSPFFALITAAVILKEKIKPFQMGVIIIAFVGALLVIKPGSGILAFPAVIGLIGGIASGTAYTMLRLSGKRGIPGPYVVFFFSAFTFFTIGPLALIEFKPMSLLQFVLLIGAGSCAAIGQFAMTKAYFFAPAREISVFDYTQVIFSAIFGYFAFHQIPDVLSFIGYIIIMLMAGANFWYNNKYGERN